MHRRRLQVDNLHRLLNLVEPFPSCRLGFELSIYVHPRIVAKASAESAGEKKDSPKPLNIKGKTVAIVGSGASGIEAAEWAVEKGAGKVLLLARFVL